MEVKPEQGGSHAGLVVHRRCHGALDRRQRVRAGRVVERRRQLRRRRCGQTQKQDRRARNADAPGKSHDHLIQSSTQSAYLSVRIYSHTQTHPLVCDSSATNTTPRDGAT